MTDELEWNDVENVNYNAEWTDVNGYRVVVSLDDEGPLRPAYYWTVGSIIKPYHVDGWAASVEQARIDAVARAGTNCRYCGRHIVFSSMEGWVDPAATGDDSVWREVCDAHDTRTAEHEPS